MARDQTERPMKDAQLREAREALQRLRAEVRRDLATDLGGDPEDYRANRHLQETPEETNHEAVPDGGP